MGDTRRFLSNFFKVFTKTAVDRKPGKSEGSEKHSRIQNPTALPEEIINRQFSLAEIKSATNNFDRDLIIARGALGFAYKGVMDDGNLVVAIKRFTPDAVQQGCNTFQMEVLLLSQLRHQHLVSLIGFCYDKNEMILVYEYMRNRTLCDHLHGSNHDPLPWKQRLEICVGAARGLHYLHTGLKYAVIHRDIRTSSFLLDENCVCKLSDFRLSKMRSLARTKALEKIDSRVRGTFGYLDPEYLSGDGLTEKSDVYSFGVVLFEVLCARRVMHLGLDRDQVNLAVWARSCVEKGTIHGIIDPYLIGRTAPESFKIFVDIAYSCTSKTGKTRPDMGEVEVMLELALEMQEKYGSEMVHLDPHYEFRYEDVSFPDPRFSVESTNTSIVLSDLESLDTNCSWDAFPCQSSTTSSKMDLEPLDTPTEHSWESRCKMVDDMKSLLESDNLACLHLSSKNFVQPLTKFLSTAHELHDIRASRAGLQLLLTFLSQNRTGVQYLDEDAYSLVSLFLDSEVTKEALDIIEVLSRRTSSRSKIAASGALASIFNILDFNTNDLRKEVIKILCKLSLSDDVCTSLMYLECIPKLVTFLNDPTLAKHCIIVLRNLCNNNGARHVLAETSGGIASVAKLLLTGSYKDQERAGAVLLGLCSQSVQYCRRVKDVARIPAGFVISYNGSKKGRAIAMELQRLFRDDDASNYSKEKKSHKTLFGLKFPISSLSIIGRTKRK